VPGGSTDAGLRTVRPFEKGVTLAPGVYLLALGTGHSVEPDGAIFPSPWVGREPGGDGATRYRAADHHLKRLATLEMRASTPGHD
jgi:hypothetical protein